MTERAGPAARSQWRVASGAAAPKQPVTISLASLLATTAALLWPAIYNGFPLVFYDTGEYIATLMELTVPIHRPVYYGLFVGFVGYVISLSTVPLIQSLAVSYVVLLFFRWLAPMAPRSLDWLLIGGLAVLTPIGWLASWLMPDFLGGLVIVCTVLLLFASDRLRPLQQVLLAAILLFALVSHTGNILLFGAFGVCTAGAAVLARRCLDFRSIGVLAGLGVAGVVLSVLPNVIGHGRWTINPGSQAFITARLIGDGLMQPYLAKHCPSEPNLPLCDRQGELVGMTHNDFLWHGSPASASGTGAWFERAKEFRELNSRVVSDNLGTVVRISAHNAAELLIRTEVVNDPLDHNFRAYGNQLNVSRKIKRHFPAELTRYEESRQQRGNLSLDAVNWIHLSWTWTSYVLLGLVLVSAWRRGSRILVAVAALVILGLLLNAFVHGALSGVHTRYQAKVTWIPTLAAFACFASLLWHRASPDVDARIATDEFKLDES